MKNFIANLQWRGMIHDSIRGTEAQLKKEQTAGYIGFDPTAPSLHIGNLATIMLLKHFQLAGHKPMVLIGGATGMIGDPSGKAEERKLLDEDVLRHHQIHIKKQLYKFLDFTCEENAVEMVNNYDWFKEFNLLSFLREVGKHLSLNYMMAKDSVKQRLESGLSFTEFSYQLVQGYDFYWLYQNKGCRLQLGGSDQWGNIVTGTELIRRKTQGEAFAVTTPLIKKADGSKFGKTESGNVWLDPARTSPYQFYQYWLNASDEDASNYTRIFTLMDKEEIEALEKEHNEAPHLRKLQQALAKDITIRVHSEVDYEMALKASQVLFGKSTTEDLAALDERTLLSVFEGVPQTEISKESLESAPDVTELLSETANGLIFKSKGEARRMIQGGGVSVNKQKLTDPSQRADFELLQDKYLVAQKGKKNYYLLKIK